MTTALSRLRNKTGRAILRAWARTAKAPGWHYQAMERFGSRFAGTHPLPASLPNGCQMICDLTDCVQRQIFFLGAYEPIEAFVFTHLLQAGMNVIDAGANVGQYTLLASPIVGCSGRVHSFEPIPPTFSRLRQHVDLNQLTNISLNRLALWNEATALQLALSSAQLGNIGAYSVGVLEGKTSVACPATTLDDYVRVQGIDRVDFIKMDIEGAELQALQGAAKVLHRDHPSLLLEVCRETTSRLGYDVRDLWNLLHDDLGYHGYLLNGELSSHRELDQLDDIKQSNILFCFGAIPDILTETWTLKSCLQWAITA